MNNYRAEIYVTYGLGLEKVKVAAGTYTDLKTKVTNVKNKLVGKTVKVLREEVEVIVEKIVYNFPSGKKFVESF